MPNISSAKAAIAALFGCSLMSTLVISISGARAAELKVLSTVALTPALDELKPRFESNGDRLTIVYNTIAELKKRIEGGETADVIVLSRPILDEFAGQGKIVQGSVVTIGASYVAVGVRAGAPVPDISTAEKLKAVLLAAKSISYADPSKGGASGVYFAKVLDRLGITEEMKPKTKLVPNAQAGELVVSGEAEIGVAQASEIAAVPGTVVVGPLPGDLNSRIVFAVGIGSTCQNPAAAKALIDLLASPAAAAVMKSKGLDPA
jgi:molybdate transport system substrate-binding protein